MATPKASEVAVRQYRCFLHPVDGAGFPLPVETGVLQFIQLRAKDAEHAQRQAAHVSGKPVSRVERIEVAA